MRIMNSHRAALRSVAGKNAGFFSFLCREMKKEQASHLSYVSAHSHFTSEVSLPSFPL